ncbi:MAG: cation transporting ATPase C-terminal domain-containing protein [Gaiellaceae bacterium]
MTFLGIIACQVGTTLAARTERRSLREVGLTTNRLLLWGIAFELAFAAVVVATPAQPVPRDGAAALGRAPTAAPVPARRLGADELWRARGRRCASSKVEQR